MFSKEQGEQGGDHAVDDVTCRIAAPVGDSRSK